jgi:hypothetical protein
VPNAGTCGHSDGITPKTYKELQVKTVRTLLIGAGAAAAFALGSAALAQEAKPGEKPAEQAAGCAEGGRGAHGMQQMRERHAMHAGQHGKRQGRQQNREKHEHQEHQELK